MSDKKGLTLEQNDFVRYLAGQAAEGEKFAKREAARNAAKDTMRAELDSLVKVKVKVKDKDGQIVKDKDGKEKEQEVEMTLRDSIRSAMQVNLVDAKGNQKDAFFHEDGQQYAADTEDATSRGLGLGGKDSQDFVAVQNALQKAMAVADKLRNQKGPDGQPLYKEEELMDEVFTPMVREGLLPDNLLIAKYSATDELLSASVASYRKAFDDADKAKQDKRDKNSVDLGGGGGKLGTFKAVLGSTKGMVDEVQNRLLKLSPLSPDQMRQAKLAAGIGYSLYKFDKQNKGDFHGVLAEFATVVPDSMVREIDGYIQPIADHVHHLNTELMDDLQKHASPVANVLSKVETKVGDHVKASYADMWDTSSTVVKPDPGKPVRKFEAFLRGEQAEKAGTILAAFMEKMNAHLPPGDDAVRGELFEKAMKKIEEVTTQIDGDLVKLADEIDKYGQDNPKEVDTAAFLSTYGSTCFSALKSLEKTAVGGVVLPLIDIKGVQGEVNEAERLGRMQQAMREAVQACDVALVGAVSAVDPVAGVAMGGALIKNADVNKMVTAAMLKPADGKTVVGGFAHAVSQAVTKIAPKGARDVFAKMGQAIAGAVNGKVNVNQLETALKNTPTVGLNLIVAAVAAAAKKELGGAGDADKPADAANATAFANTVKDPEQRKAMIAQGALPDAEEAEQEMYDADEETRYYENSILLLDTGGMDAAQAANIEKMIAELQRNRKILELVAGLGQGLIGTGTTITSKLVSTGAAPAPVLDAFKLAKMILTLAVNTKKAADRWVLWYKFQTNLDRSKKAVSALTSSIRGFYKNKQAQIAFHTIDDALTAIQIAATVVGMVPEPITMGIGKTVNAVAGAAQSANTIAGKIFDEVMLSKAWETTISFINNKANRKLGLAAMELNPTLSMHAVAWAGGQRRPPDAIALSLMNDLGISAQTIAAGASPDKLRAYLEELLPEDRKLDDSGRVNNKWLPPSYGLSAEDFYSIYNRGAKLASPKLQIVDEAGVADALKPLDGHNMAKLNERALLGDIAFEEMPRLISESERALAALRNYRPRSADQDLHDEMNNVKARFLSDATKHLDQIAALEPINSDARDRVMSLLQDQMNANLAIPADADAEALGDRLDSTTFALGQMNRRPALSADRDAKDLIDRLNADLDRIRDMNAALS